MFDRTDLQPADCEVTAVHGAAVRVEGGGTGPAARRTGRRPFADTRDPFEPAGQVDLSDLQTLVDLVRAVAGVDRSVVSDEVLLAEVPLLERARRGLEAALGSALAELDRRGTTDVRFGHRTAVWFAVAVNCSRGEARRRLGVGRRLARLETVRESLAVGEVSFEHARVLTDLATPRNEEVVARLQAELVELAGSVPFEVWRTEVRAVVDLADADGGFRPGPEGSTLCLSAGFGGSVEMTGTFCGLDGAGLRDAVEREADRLRLHHRDQVRAGNAETVPTRAELCAEALVALVRQGLAAGRTGRAPATDVTLVAHAADPLGRTHHGAHPCAGPTATMPTSPGTTRTSDLAEHTVRTLCCDPVLRTVVLDSLGNPLDLGRRTRLVPPSLRRAIEVRDGGCVFPGCDAPPAWCDQHHVIHWKDGGPTSVENLASLCRYHHGVTHRTGWTMTVDPDRAQRFRWTRPDGTVVHSQRHGDPPTGTGPPRE